MKIELLNAVYEELQEHANKHQKIWPNNDAYHILGIVSAAFRRLETQPQPHKAVYPTREEEESSEKGEVSNE